MRSVSVKIVLCFFFARLATRFVGGSYFNMPATSVFAYPYPYLAAIYAFIISYLLLVKPLKRIEKVINQFRSGSFDARIRMKRNDELGNISAAFDDMADRIQIMIHSERRMTANLGHEIRTPLTRVMLYLDKLKDKIDVDQTIELIEQEIHELSEVSIKLLKLAQIERGEIKPVFESIDLDNFIRKAILKMKTTANSRHCTIEFNPDYPIRIFTDKDLLEIALTNILDNAIHYTSQKSVIKVLIDSGQASETPVLIKVRDQGQGVPEVDIKRIFMPFERVEQSRDRKTGGTGLGLAICSSIVNSLGGTVEAQNLNPGFEVCISLPLKV